MWVYLYIVGMLKDTTFVVYKLGCALYWVFTVVGLTWPNFFALFVNSKRSCLRNFSLFCTLLGAGEVGPQHCFASFFLCRINFISAGLGMAKKEN